MEFIKKDRQEELENRLDEIAINQYQSKDPKQKRIEKLKNLQQTPSAQTQTIKPKSLFLEVRK